MFSRSKLRSEVAALKASSSSTQLVQVEELRHTLHRRISQWRPIQGLYMPCVSSLDLPLEDANLNEPEEIPLWLPSCFPDVSKATPPVRAAELRLRIAQADDSLNEVRRTRRIVQSLVEYKKKHVSGTGNKANTRARAILQRFQEKALAHVACYRSAFRALQVLDPGGSWTARFRELRADDVRGPGRDSDASEGRHEASWIWLVPASSGQDGSGVLSSASIAEVHVNVELDDTIRVEWSKTRARALRWGEEVQLLEEEMRRVLVFLEWRSRWWQAQSHRRSVLDEELRTALVAYASKQAAIFMRLAAKFAKSWRPLFPSDPVWLSRFATLPVTASESPSECDADDDDEE